MAAQDIRIWRRGPAPTPAGTGEQADHGYFGPGSQVWRVLLHPVVTPFLAPVTALLEVPHIGMQAVLIDHDPLAVTGRAQRSMSPIMAVRRAQRTVGVPVPIILGDKASADRIAAHLRRYHRSMTGTVPGTGEPYAAQGPELVLFAHVTIMQAALLVYENLAYEGGRRPARLAPGDRDRFWLEAKQFGVLMGANPDEIPTSCREVADYYAGIAHRYGVIESFGPELAVAPTLALIRGFALTQLPELAPLLLSAVLTPQLMATLPRPARRNLGIPAALDPVLNLSLRLTRPAMRAFTIRRFAEAVERRISGPDAVALSAHARRLQAALA
ncbi:oxygenase MpaB family protein [Nocardia sp. CDC160]|uniref:oxygenase MpaB family protein n=1 Tax=Nocardia sp. CDC160 TaxID=3112166 RepID=UPI002DBAFDEB|nr:oxygenase MpaB family protein [Nocardia sp. CDC160]MEC3914642.1 oxygenase MpaB family protein [Nocardia sp. CDC160]